MKRIGTISYNIYCNFTNYGSALQTWALHQTIKKLGGDEYHPVLVDYCPDILADKNPLSPFTNMWDRDENARLMCELSIPAIRINYAKFNQFYHDEFDRTTSKYTYANFNDIVFAEKLEGFVCGSDTIFCPDEFGFDDGYYANYECMKKKSVAYAASFGDPQFSKEAYRVLDERICNFKAFGLRENLMVPYVSKHTTVPVKKVIDPTLLLTSVEYDRIAAKEREEEKYILLYDRRYNASMETYAEQLASQNGWKIVEISLRATNANKPNRKMFYEAGVGEFLSLVKHAEFVITNSYHGMIFSVLYQRPFYVFSREQCDTKITELLQMFGLDERMIVGGDKINSTSINYVNVNERIAKARSNSLTFLREELKLLG